MTATASIYGLYDAAGNLRYIGKANDPAKRLKGHMRDARRRRTPVYDWINKHGQPEMRILEADCSDWAASERRLIAEARSRGDMLLNIADGGDQPECPTEVCRANAASMNAKRHNNILRGYRNYEYHVRMSRKWFPHATAKMQIALETYRQTVAECRSSGRLDELDRLLGEMFEKKNAQR